MKILFFAAVIQLNFIFILATHPDQDLAAINLFLNEIIEKVIHKNGDESNEKENVPIFEMKKQVHWQINDEESKSEFFEADLNESSNIDTEDIKIINDAIVDNATENLITTEENNENDNDNNDDENEKENENTKKFVKNNAAPDRVFFLLTNIMFLFISLVLGIIINYDDFI